MAKSIYKPKITKKIMISIARAGYPSNVKQFIDFNDTEIFWMGSVYRLYIKSKGFKGMLPEEDILTICIPSRKFVQFGLLRGHPAFNHLAALQKMDIYNLI